MDRLVPGICLAQPIRTSSSLFRRSQRVNRTRRLLSLVDWSSWAVKGAGSVSSRCEITLFPEKTGDGQPGRVSGGRSWKVPREKENLLLVRADGYEPLGYKLKPVSTRRLYFCRPPRTRSKRTPARQRGRFPRQSTSFPQQRTLEAAGEAAVARLRGPTLPHHPSLQTLAEAAGLARFPPPLGDLTLIHHGAAVLNVAWETQKQEAC